MVMRVLLYPALQAPVLAAAQTPEIVTESRWHQPWSEPQRFVGVPRYLRALDIDSQQFAPLNPFGMTMRRPYARCYVVS